MQHYYHYYRIVTCKCVCLCVSVDSDGTTRQLKYEDCCPRQQLEQHQVVYPTQSGMIPNYAGHLPGNYTHLSIIASTLTGPTHGRFLYQNLNDIALLGLGTGNEMILVSSMSVLYDRNPEDCLPVCSSFRYPVSLLTRWYIRARFSRILKPTVNVIPLLPAMFRHQSFDFRYDIDMVLIK